MVWVMAVVRVMVRVRVECTPDLPKNYAFWVIFLKLKN